MREMRVLVTAETHREILPISGFFPKQFKISAF